jgi:hypothetical protein
MEISFLNTIRDMPDDFKNFWLPNDLYDAIIKANKALFDYNENLHSQNKGNFKDETIECGKHLKNCFIKWYEENTTLSNEVINNKYMDFIYGYNKTTDRIQLINLTLVRKKLYNDIKAFPIKQKKEDDKKLKEFKELLEKLIAFLNSID